MLKFRGERSALLLQMKQRLGIGYGLESCLIAVASCLAFVDMDSVLLILFAREVLTSHAMSLTY
jgi:hypothetical protein